jgi:hypothetical protein
MSFPSDVVVVCRHSSYPPSAIPHRRRSDVHEVGESGHATDTTEPEEAVAMPTFITIGYGDEDGYRRTDPAVRAAAHAHDDRLQADGALVGVAGPVVQVRNPDASGVRTSDGPFMRSDLPIAGFAVIEADSAADAVRLVAGTPCAVAHGVVEVWPVTA